MKPTQLLQDLGQSLWLDNITRGLLSSGTLAGYIRDLSVTGLTSNPTIFEKAIGDSDFYDSAIARASARGESGEALFYDLALEDLQQAADLFRGVFDKTHGVDGWVSLEVSPLLADDTAGTQEAATYLHARAKRDNLFIKIPGTPAGVPAIEESIFAGVPINVTMLFSREHYLAAAEAYLRGIERRIAAGLNPRVASVASLFVSRWDVVGSRQGSRHPAQSAWHRHGQARLQIVLRSAGVAALEEARSSRRACRSDCCGPVPERRTRQPPTRCTWKRWRRPTRSTRCLKRPCTRSLSMAA